MYCNKVPNKKGKFKIPKLIADHFQNNLKCDSLSEVSTHTANMCLISSSRINLQQNVIDEVASAPIPCNAVSDPYTVKNKYHGFSKNVKPVPSFDVQGDFSHSSNIEFENHEWCKDYNYASDTGNFTIVSDISTPHCYGISCHKYCDVTNFKSENGFNKQLAKNSVNTSSTKHNKIYDMPQKKIFLSKDDQLDCVVKETHSEFNNENWTSEQKHAFAKCIEGACKIKTEPYFIPSVFDEKILKWSYSKQLDEYFIKTETTKSMDSRDQKQVKKEKSHYTERLDMRMIQGVHPYKLNSKQLHFLGQCDVCTDTSFASTGIG